MRIDQAKQIDLRDLLDRLNIPVAKTRKSGNDLFLLAPWRNETEASVHCTRQSNGRWLWSDMGEAGQGGSVIDFIIRLKGGDTRDALRTLSSIYQGALFDSIKPVDPNQSKFSFDRSAERPAPQQEKPQSSLQLVEVKPLTSKRILQYLEGRAIPRNIAQRYLKLVRYRNIERPNDPIRYGFGMINLSSTPDSPAYEVRSALDTARGKFKTAVGGRDISYWKGSDPNSSTVSIFEGMLDYLSLLVFLGTEQLKGDAVVMNALSSQKRCEAFLGAKNYDTIALWLDNNSAGRQAAAKFREDFGDAVQDWSHSFAPHIDLNDCLKAGATLDLRKPQP